MLLSREKSRPISCTLRDRRMSPDCPRSAIDDRSWPCAHGAMADILLYQFEGDTGVESASPFCVKVHRLLGFKALAYEVKTVGSPAEMKSINPLAGKVPVLEYDGKLLTDSTRIFAFIEEHHPDPPVLPADAHERGQCALLEDWADESLYWFAVYQRWAVDSNFEPFCRRAFAKMPLPLRWFVPSMIRKQVRRDLHGQGLGRQPLATVLEMLEQHLGMLEELLSDKPFLSGEGLLACDIAVFAPLKAMAIRETAPESAAAVRGHDKLFAWMKRVDEATKSEHSVALED